MFPINRDKATWMAIRLPPHFCYCTHHCPLGQTAVDHFCALQNQILLRPFYVFYASKSVYILLTINLSFLRIFQIPITGISPGTTQAFYTRNEWMCIMVSLVTINHTLTPRFIKRHTIQAYTGGWRYNSTVSSALK